MAYELHIERNEVPISLEEWKAAVFETDGIRFCSSERHNITNPQTGEIIGLQKRDGDAEIYFPEQDSWIAVFRWSRNSAHFNARFEPGDLTNPVWKAAVTLATKLKASIRGDGGEIYDLNNGKPNKA